jgi:hypothetical protein
MRLKIATPIAAFCLSCQPTFAGVVHSLEYGLVKSLDLKSELGTKSDWRIYALQPQGENASEGDAPAKLCFKSGREDHCISISHREDNDTLTYNFQAVES